MLTSAWKHQRPQLTGRAKTAAKQFQCQVCWETLVRKSDIPQRNPPALCAQCEKSHRTFGQLSDADSSANPNTVKASTQRTPHRSAMHKPKSLDNSEILLNESLQSEGSFYSMQHHQKRQQKQVRFSDIDETKEVPRSRSPSHVDFNKLTRKLKAVELRSTHCGFCPWGAPRSILTAFCCHCRKHLCKRCHSLHSRDKLYKYHGTLDLMSTNNVALQ